MKNLFKLELIVVKWSYNFLQISGGCLFTLIASWVGGGRTQCQNHYKCLNSEIYVFSSWHWTAFKIPASHDSKKCNICRTGDQDVFPCVPSCRTTERGIGYLCTHVIVKGQQNCLSAYLSACYEGRWCILSKKKFCSYRVLILVIRNISRRGNPILRICPRSSNFGDTS